MILSIHPYNDALH